MSVSSQKIIKKIINNDNFKDFYKNLMALFSRLMFNHYFNFNNNTNKNPLVTSRIDYLLNNILNSNEIICISKIYRINLKERYLFNLKLFIDDLIECKEYDWIKDNKKLNTLKSLSRNTLRKNIKRVDVSNLNIPSNLIDYLMFKDEIKKLIFIQ